MKNDEKILKLKEMVDKQKESIGKKVVFNPKTTCSLNKDGNRINIRALNESQLIDVYVWLTQKVVAIQHTQSQDMYQQVQFEDLLIEGQPLPDWVDDVNTLIKQKRQRKRIKKFDKMKAKLDGMLSKDKKTELELNKLAEELKDM